PLAALEEGAHRRSRMAEEATTRRNVEEPLPKAAQSARALVEGHAMPADVPFQPRRPMVAQILADTAQLVLHRDAERLEPLALADACQLQQLRRGDRAGRDDDLARSARLELLALHGVAHADAARAFEQQALRVRAGLDPDIAPRARRLEIDARRAHA